ncbi:hypothetical protein FRC17_005326, partial [Serendipita sp. 399]
MHLIDSSTEIQLHIELAIDGLLLNHRGGLPATKLLGLAQHMRKAWEELDPRWHWNIPCDTRRRLTYEVYGILAYMLQHDDSDGFRGITYQELVPLELKKEPWGQEWKDIGFIAVDFSYNLHDDVQIFMEPRENGSVRRMHFRTISTNRPHPRASKPYMDIEQSDCPIWESCKTVAYENYIAMLFMDWEGPSQCGAAMIIDWKTASTPLPYIRATDLAFASKDTVILMLNEEEGVGPVLGVYSLPESRLLFRCLLPFHARAMIALFLTNPASHFGDICPATHAKRFIADPEVRIIGMIFRTWSNNEMYGARFETHLAALSVQRLLRNCARHSPRSGEVTLQWNDWGPSVTRWLPSTNFTYVGFRSTFGSRMLAVMTDPKHPGIANSLAVLDFNPRPILRGYRDRDTEHYVTKVLPRSSEFKMRDTGTMIESHLPARVTALPGTIPFQSAFMDGTTFIGSL